MAMGGAAGILTGLWVDWYDDQPLLPSLTSSDRSLAAQVLA